MAIQVNNPEPLVTSTKSATGHLLGAAGGRPEEELGLDTLQLTCELMSTVNFVWILYVEFWMRNYTSGGLYVNLIMGRLF